MTPECQTSVSNDVMLCSLLKRVPAIVLFVSVCVPQIDSRDCEVLSEQSRPEQSRPEGHDLPDDIIDHRGGAWCLAETS